MENLKFDILLTSTQWGKVPEFNIYIDDNLIEHASCNERHESSFMHEIADGDHELRIELLNKTNDDCVQNADKTEIIKDMQLHVSNIKIDHIDLGLIRHTCSTFVPKDPEQHETLKECVDLGWNGIYILKFTSPFYIWLLENM